MRRRACARNAASGRPIQQLAVGLHGLRVANGFHIVGLDGPLRPWPWFAGWQVVCLPMKPLVLSMLAAASRVRLGGFGAHSSLPFVFATRSHCLVIQFGHGKAGLRRGQSGCLLASQIGSAMAWWLIRSARQALECSAVGIHRCVRSPDAIAPLIHGNRASRNRRAMVSAWVCACLSSSCAEARFCLARSR